MPVIPDILTPADVCAAAIPAFTGQDYPVKDLWLLWDQARGELWGYANYLQRRHASLTAAQLRMAITLADRALPARGGEDTHVSAIRTCARCGGDHPHLVFRQLTEASHDWTHWAICPTVLEPLMLKFVDGA